VLTQRRAIEVASFILGLSGMLGPAHAEPLLVSLEGQGAVAITTPQSEQFGPGFNLALSARYALGPMLQVGAEARAGLLSAGEGTFAVGQAEPQPGSYELAMLMVRVKPLAWVDGTSPRRAAGLFLDLGAGGGVTGKVARAGFQGGLGFGFGLGGGITLAPTVRYLQVIQPADPLSSRDARLMLFGLELSAFDAVARVHHALPEPPRSAGDRQSPGTVARASVAEPPRSAGDRQSPGTVARASVAEPPPPTAIVPEPAPEPSDRDHDRIVDAEDRCPDQPEVVNGKDDQDGCPDEGLIELKDDRIVLDAQVLFDAGFARVRHAAWAALEAIAKLKQQHPEWLKIRVEGHADARGSEKLNQELSERRARNAMKHLIKIGVPAEQLEAHGYGSSRPRDPRSSEEAHTRNRRVEFVVIREGSDAVEVAEPAHAPAPSPTPESATPATPVQPRAATPAPAQPQEPPAPPAAPAPPTKSGLTPSGLRPIPSEEK
jgi:outer membrane protein OmpA-like peptidoglycan-associated protein